MTYTFHISNYGSNMNKIKPPLKYKPRYQHCPRHIKIYRWLKWIPFAYVRGIYWYLFKNNMFGDDYESFHTCTSLSIGDVQCPYAMNWVYPIEELLGINNDTETINK